MDHGLEDFLLLKVKNINSTSKSINAINSSKQSIWGVINSLWLGRQRLCTLEIFTWDFVQARSRQEHWSWRWRIRTFLILPWDFVQAISRHKHHVGGILLPSKLGSWGLRRSFGTRWYTMRRGSSLASSNSNHKRIRKSLCDCLIYDQLSVTNSS